MRSRIWSTFGKLLMCGFLWVNHIPTGMAGTEEPAAAMTAPASALRTKTAVMFGDSITAGYGLATEESIPVITESFLRAKGINVTVVNAGVSGDTTGGGLNRLPWTLDTYRPDLVIMELGANDMLRGLDPATARANLDEMLRLLQQRHVPVILTSVTAAPNLGVPYQEAFNKIYPELAAKYRAPLYPFLLNDTFGRPGLMQEDGIHPSAAGAKIIAEKMAAYLEKVAAATP